MISISILYGALAKSYKCVQEENTKFQGQNDRFLHSLSLVWNKVPVKPIGTLSEAKEEVSWNTFQMLWNRVGMRRIHPYFKWTRFQIFGTVIPVELSVLLLAIYLHTTSTDCKMYTALTLSFCKYTLNEVSSSIIYFENPVRQAVSFSLKFSKCDFTWFLWVSSRRKKKLFLS